MSENKKQGPVVVLIHGLWTNDKLMRYQARFFRRAGYETALFSYPSVRRSPEANILALHQFITSLGGRPFSIVAHSLGGLIAAGYIQQYKPENIRRLVLLGSPVAGSSVARSLARTRLGRRMLGKSIGLLLEGSVEVCGVETAAISGSQGLGLGRLVTRLDKPCDGAVSIAETKADWLKHHAVVHKSHSGMLFSSLVASKAVEFIRYGRFAH